MNRLFARPANFRLASVVVLVALSLPLMQAAAQQDVPAAPAQNATAAAPSTPVPTTAPIFPTPSPANFTAASPTKEVVNAFLQTNWGYDENRVWQVQAILKTPAEGVSKVIVYVGEKGNKDKTSALQFIVLPDGKHIIAGDDVINFGEHPFAETRAILQQRANGPYRGSPAKDLELVEFADFQCPHCKEAQANMEKLVADFPKARIVLQMDPLESIHPQSANAAAYALCVNKEGGSNTFFQFASSVFDGQDGLATADGATLTLNSAVAKVGLEPAKIAACAATPEIKAQVKASEKLAEDLDVNQVPMLMVNGRAVAANMAYDTLKQIIQYQAKIDGIAQ